MKCLGAAYLHSGRAAALAIVLSGAPLYPSRPGVLLVCFKIHPFLFRDPGDWTCISCWVTSLAACTQVGLLYNVFPIICLFVGCSIVHGVMFWIHYFCWINCVHFWEFFKMLLPAWLLAHRLGCCTMFFLSFICSISMVWCFGYNVFDSIFLATLVALHFTPVSEWVSGQSFELA